MSVGIYLARLFAGLGIGLALCWIMIVYWHYIDNGGRGIGERVSACLSGLKKAYGKIDRLGKD